MRFGARAGISLSRKAAAATLPMLSGAHLWKAAHSRTVARRQLSATRFHPIEYGQSFAYASRSTDRASTKLLQKPDAVG